MMLRVNALVPKNLPEQVRQEVCQDALVLILTSPAISDVELANSIQGLTRSVFRQFPTKYGPLSLDAPRSGDDDRTLLDRLSADRYGVGV